MILRAVLADAAETLRASGVDSPEQDARLLAAHVLGVEPMWLATVADISDAQQTAFVSLVARRARRIPLQHLTGVAYFRYLQLAVGPGVFVPRPETEVMTGWAIDQLLSMIAAGNRRPVVVELCAGSGAIAKAIATEATGCEVHAVEISPDAVTYAARNLAEVPVWLHVADMAVAVPELDGLVDLVIANPPYIPLDAFESVAVEARDHDPPVALFSGDDGLDAIRVLLGVADRLLRPGGLLCFEHADVQGAAAAGLTSQQGGFCGVRDHKDLTGRARFVTAVRRGST